ALGRRAQWLQASWSEGSDGPRPQVARVLKQAPEDVELQIASATLPPALADKVVPALEQLAQRFPRNAAIRAHQLRHLTRSGLSIRRAEFADFASPGF